MIVEKVVKSENSLNSHTYRRLLAAGIAPVLLLISGLVNAELRLPPVYIDQAVMQQRLAPVITIANKALWVEIESDGEGDNTLQNLLREAFRNEGYNVVANEEDSEATVKIKIVVKVNNDQPTRAKSIPASSWLALGLSLSFSSVGWQSGQWVFKDESAYKAKSGRASNPMLKFQLKDTPIYGYMETPSVLGGVYVLVDAVPAKPKGVKTYFTEAIMNVTVASDGRSASVGSWFVASANHIPIVPLLERMFDDVFKVYGEDAPRIRFPKITALPAHPPAAAD